MPPPMTDFCTFCCLYLVQLHEALSQAIHLVSVDCASQFIFSGQSRSGAEEGLFRQSERVQFDPWTMFSSMALFAFPILTSM